MSVRPRKRSEESVVSVEVIRESSNPYAHLTDRQIAALLARHRPEYREAYREVFGRVGRGKAGQQGP
jgi:hypothetical protein